MLTSLLPGPQTPTVDHALASGLESARKWREPVVYRFDGREVIPACRVVMVKGVPRRLQPRAFDLLVHLIEHRHRVLSIDELLDAVWYDRDVQVGSLATAIARIRSALREGEGGDAPLIETHHRVGYRFVATLNGDAGVSS